MKYPDTLTKEWATARVCDKIGPMPTPCWIWLGAIALGYGVVKHRGRGTKAHRLFWRIFVGPIRGGHDIHHKCEVKLCCNPDHLESLTRSEHSRKHGNVLGHNQHKGKTHCSRGHEFTEETTRWSMSRGILSRRCMLCLKLTQKAWYQSKHSTPTTSHPKS